MPKRTGAGLAGHRVVADLERRLEPSGLAMMKASPSPVRDATLWAWWTGLIADYCDQADGEPDPDRRGVPLKIAECLITCVEGEAHVGALEARSMHLECAGETYYALRRPHCGPAAAASRTALDVGLMGKAIRLGRVTPQRRTVPADSGETPTQR